METRQNHNYNSNSTPLKNGDVLKFKMANKEFTDEWTVIAAREAARIATERRILAEQIDDFDYYETKLMPNKRELSPEQKIANEIQAISSKIVNFRTEKVDEHNAEQKAA